MIVVKMISSKARVCPFADTDVEDNCTVQTLQTRLTSVLERSALRIQGTVRVWFARRAVEARLEALLCLQAVFRRFGGRRSYMRAQSEKYATTIQCAVRRAVAQRPIRILAAAARRMQTVFRVRNDWTRFGGTAIMAAESLQSCQDKTLARLPKLLAKLEEFRWEIAQLKELNSMLIVQVENEAEQVRYVLQSFEQHRILLGSTAKNCCSDLSLPVICP